MSNFTVFFRDGVEPVPAKTFIAKQAKYFTQQLEEAAAMLSMKGRIDGFKSALLMDGDWSIWLEDLDGERHNFVLFVSQLEVPREPAKKTQLNSPSATQLVIVDPNGPKDTIGGQHPGYWSIEEFASGMDSIGRETFMKVISDIKLGRSSEHYSKKPDGSISIHINRSDLGYGVQIYCEANFI